MGKRMTMTCPVCHARVTAAIEHAGQKIRCPGCHTTRPLEEFQPRAATASRPSPPPVAPAMPPRVDVALPTYSSVACPRCQHQLTLDPPKSPGALVQCGMCGETLTVLAPNLTGPRRVAAAHEAGGILGGLVGGSVGAIGCGGFGLTTGGLLAGVIFGSVGFGLGMMVGTALLGLLAGFVARLAQLRSQLRRR